MRTIAKLLPAVVGVIALAAGGVASAAPAMRDWVPADALVPYRAVAAQFASTQAAEDAGYGEISDLAGISCIADPAGSGAMGYHWVDGGRLFDGELNASEPEAVVYEQHPDGSFHLVALEYIIFQDQTGGATPELFPGHPFMPTGADNRFGLPAFYSQHVWVGKGNPLGNLSMWNPAVHC
jgi:hypothetical protein